MCMLFFPRRKPHKRGVAAPLSDCECQVTRCCWRPQRTSRIAKNSLRKSFPGAGLEETPILPGASVAGTASCAKNLDVWIRNLSRFFGARVLSTRLARTAP